jgi:DNA-binding FadR family transcriptional regulator
MKLLATLHKNCDRYVRLQLLGGNHIERAEAEHRQLVELCRTGDKTAAQSLLHDHIVRVEEDIVAALLPR